MLKKTGLVLAVLCLCLLTTGAVSAQSFALVEASSGRLLRGRETDRKLPMASTTKIMTGLLACESGRLDETFTVPAEALKVEGSSMGLVAGERLTLRELTYGLLLESGNDAAGAIAYLLDGSIPAFAERMNRRAAALGLTGTHFANPSGLDDAAHYTTALDLARLGAAAMKNEEFAAIASTYTARVPYNGIQGGRLLCNHNELLNLYEGAIGIKTGYTRRSGRCLVSCAVRNGVKLVAATLNGHEDFDDHTALLDYGFKTIRPQLLFSSPPYLPLKVLFGEAKSVSCGCDLSLTASLSDAELTRLRTEVLMPEFVYAPVCEGKKVGTLVFRLDGVTVAEADIRAEDTVDLKRPQPGLAERFLNLFQ